MVRRANCPQRPNTTVSGRLGNTGPRPGLRILPPVSTWIVRWRGGCFAEELWELEKSKERKKDGLQFPIAFVFSILRVFAFPFLPTTRRLSAEMPDRDPAYGCCSLFPPGSSAAVEAALRKYFGNSKGRKSERRENWAAVLDRSRLSIFRAFAFPFLPTTRRRLRLAVKRNRWGRPTGPLPQLRPVFLPARRHDLVADLVGLLVGQGAGLATQRKG